MADKATSALTAGSSLSVADLIYAVIGGNSRKLTAGQVGVAFGTSFPGSPATDDRFYRTDRRIEYFYDGTRWLSTQLFQLDFSHAVAVATDFDAYHTVPYRDTYGLWMERFESVALRTAAGEWDVALAWVTAGNVSTTIVTNDGSAAVTNNWDERVSSIGAVLDSTARMLKATYDEISGSASLYAQATLFYRLIG